MHGPVKELERSAWNNAVLRVSAPVVCVDMKMVLVPDGVLLLGWNSIPIPHLDFGEAEQAF